MTIKEIMIDKVLLASTKQLQERDFKKHIKALKEFDKEDLENTLECINNRIESFKYLLLNRKISGSNFDRKMDRYFWIYNNIAAVLGEEQFAVVPTSEGILNK